MNFKSSIEHIYFYMFNITKNWLSFTFKLSIQKKKPLLLEIVYLDYKF